MTTKRTTSTETAGERLRLVGYCRVSTANQRDEGTVEIQEQALAAFATSKGHELVTIFRDEAVSGAKDLENRPGLVEALDALDADPTLDGVLIWKLDRLARDLYVQEFIIRELQKRDKALVSVKDGDALTGTGDPMRTAFRQFMGVVAQLEKAFITMRLSAGRVNKARKGGYAGGGCAMGYRVKDSELHVDQAGADTVRMIFSLRARRLSLRDIARQLNEEAVPTARGGRWQAATVSYILRNQKYHGNLTYSGQSAARADLDLLAVVNG